MSKLRSHNIHQFRQLINTDEQLYQLHRHTKAIRALNEVLAYHLAPPLNHHSKVANYSEDTLILYTDTSAWAAKLRFNTPAIRKYMQKNSKLTKLKTIRIKVLPPSDHALMRLP